MERRGGTRRGVPLERGSWRQGPLLADPSSSSSSLPLLLREGCSPRYDALRATPPIVPSPPLPPLRRAVRLPPPLPVGLGARARPAASAGAVVRAALGCAERPITEPDLERTAARSECGVISPPSFFPRPARVSQPAHDHRVPCAEHVARPLVECSMSAKSAGESLNHQTTLETSGLDT